MESSSNVTRVNITAPQDVASNFGSHGGVLPETFSDPPPSYEECLLTDQPTDDQFSGQDSERATIYNCLYDESNFNATFDHRHRQADIVQLQEAPHSNGWYDWCFTRSCVCECSGRNVIPEYITSGSLHRGRVLGWNVFRKMVLPLVGDVFRIGWAAYQLIMWIILIILSSFNYASGRRGIYNIIHLSLSVVALLLACIDLGGSVIHKIKKSRPSSTCNRLNANGSTHSLDASDDHATTSTSATTTATAATTTASDNVGSPNSNRKEWTKFSNTDIARLIIPELLLFPIVICDVFMLINDDVFKFESTLDWTSFVELLFSLILLVIQVYVLRLALLAIMTYRVHTKRSLPTGLNHTQEVTAGAGYDPKIRKKGLIYLSFFIFNVVTHMINQIAMILAIGVKIHDYITATKEPPTTAPCPYKYTSPCYYKYDHRFLYDSDKLPFNFWFMIVAGYVLPIVGAWLFFGVTHFWLQEFAIGIAVDYLSILKLPGAGNVFFPNCSPYEAQNKVKKILVYNKYGTLRQHYNVLQNYNPLSKAFYPFTSISHTLICIAYTTVQAVFIYTAAFSIQGRQFNMAVFLLVIITELLSNIYVVLVSLFWIVGISVVLLLFCIAMCCAAYPNSPGGGPPTPPQIRMRLQQV